MPIFQMAKDRFFLPGIKEILKSKMIPKFQAIKLALGLVTSAKSNFKEPFIN